MTPTTTMNEDLSVHLAFIKKRAQHLSSDRKMLLNRIVDLLKSKMENGEAMRLKFICTHNSRRSQFAHFWSSYFTLLFDLPVCCCSGGTEVTACHPMVIHSLEKNGFTVEKETKNQENPKYIIPIPDSKDTITLFSKLHTDQSADDFSFAAIMCCAQAEESCPAIPSAEARIPLFYEDPGWSDGKPKEEDVYLETNLMIASEMYYVFSSLKED